MTDVASLTSSHLEDAATTLGRAFAVDPMFGWVFPDPARRERGLRRLNHVPVRFGLRWGRATQAEGGRAVAVWVPPGEAATPLRMLRSGLLGVPLATGLPAFGRSMVALGPMDPLHARHAPDPHWYLMLIGVDPAAQGRGLGSALVAEGLARADDMRTACYLETSSPRNLPFYQGHGFVVVGEARLGKDGPPAWAMRREPR